MAVFLDRILVQKHDSADLFLMTKEEMIRVSTKKVSVRETDYLYENYLKKVRDGFGKFETKQGFRTVQITDTFTHKRREWDNHYRALEMHVHFTDDTTHYDYPVIVKEQYFTFIFCVIGDHLRLMDYRSRLFKPDVAETRMDYAETEAQRTVTDAQFRRFNSVFWSQVFSGRALPFRKKGKWGFQSADGKILFPAVCDSLYPDQTGYVMIAQKGHYNLLDSNFLRVLPNDVKIILPGPFYCLSTGVGKPQGLDFFTQSRNDVKLPPAYTLADSISRIKTAYIFSEDGENFYALKPYLEVAEMVVGKSGLDENNRVADSLLDAHPERYLSKLPVYGQTNEPQVQILENPDRLKSPFRDIPEKRVYPAQAQSRYELHGYTKGILSGLYIVLNRSEDTVATFTGWEHLTLYNDVLLGRRNDSTYIMEPDGKVLFQTHLYCRRRGLNTVEIFDASTGLMGAYMLNARRSIPVRYRSIHEVYGALLVVTKDYRYGFLNAQGEELFD